eukprot:scaffold305467_cov71-Attheya_sp.AAC.2
MNAYLLHQIACNTCSRRSYTAFHPLCGCTCASFKRNVMKAWGQTAEKQRRVFSQRIPLTQGMWTYLCFKALAGSCCSV